MSRLWDVGAALVAVAVVYVLVRPQSKGAELVTAIGDLFTATIAAVTTVPQQKGA